MVMFNNRLHHCFYEVSQGTININGIPLSDYSMASLRSKIGLVQQDVYIYSTSPMKILN